MRLFFVFLSVLITGSVFSQLTTPAPAQDSSSVIVHKDQRLDMLIRKQIEINEETSRDARRIAKGFRLLVVNTNKREDAIAAKTKVYTFFPELKPYLIYQSPYYRLKVGNFKERKDAEAYQLRLNAYFPKGVFIVNDIIEVKLDTDPPDSNL
ncbi:MAG: SPOR domain-containing protein [Bacteroidetes bacterium]|nr:SPOR domain-containing protein [Bacteroidota bacterium]